MSHERLLEILGQPRQDLTSRSISEEKLRECIGLVQQVGPEAVRAAVDGKGWTPLHYLCHAASPTASSVKLCQALVAVHPTAVKAPDSDGATPLHYLCNAASPTEWSVELYRALVAEHAAEQAPDNDGATPLHYLCNAASPTKWSVKLYKLLIAAHRGAIQGAVQAPDNDDWTPLHYLCMAASPTVWSVKLYRLLVAVHPAAVQATDSDSCTPLHYLCSAASPTESSVELYRLLVATHPAAIQAADNDGWTPLHYLCNADSPTAWSVALYRAVVAAHPAAGQATDNDGATPLHYLCDVNSPTEWSVELFRALVAAHPGGVQATDNDGWTPLHSLCKAPSPTESSVMLYRALVAEHEGAVLATDNDGWTPLHSLCSAASPTEWSVELNRALVAAHPTAVHETDNDGWTPLHHLCSTTSPTESSVELCQALVAAYPAIVHEKDNDSCTPLHNLCKAPSPTASSLKLCLALVAAYPAIVHETDNDGWTPLHSLCKVASPTKSSVDLCRVLVADRDAAVIQVPQADNHGHTALQSLCNVASPTVWSVELCQELVEVHPAAVRATDNDGSTPLHYLCHAASPTESSVKLYRALVAKHRDAVKATDSDGWTPLHYLCSAASPTEWSVELYRALVADGVFQATDKNEGQTPLHYLCKAASPTASSVALYRLLIEARPAVKQATDECGRTALHSLCHAASPTRWSLVLYQELAALAAPQTGRTADLYGWTPLHYLCNAASPTESSVELYERLVADSAAVQATANNGCTPLHALCKAASPTASSVKICQALLNAHSPAAKAKDFLGHTPLQSLCQVASPTASSLELFEAVVTAHTAAVQDFLGCTPLHSLCQAASPTASSVELYRALVAEHPAAVQTTDNGGATPLHYLCDAASPTESSVVLLLNLLSQGPSANSTALRNFASESPMHTFFKKLEHKAMVECSQHELVMSFILAVVFSPQITMAPVVPVLKDATEVESWLERLEDAEVLRLVERRAENRLALLLGTARLYVALGDLHRDSEVGKKCEETGERYLKRASSLVQAEEQPQIALWFSGDRWDPWPRVLPVLCDIGAAHAEPVLALPKIVSTMASLWNHGISESDQTPSTWSIFSQGLNLALFCAEDKGDRGFRVLQGFLSPWTLRTPVASLVATFVLQLCFLVILQWEATLFSCEWRQGGLSSIRLFLLGFWAVAGAVFECGQVARSGLEQHLSDTWNWLDFVAFTLLGFWLAVVALSPESLECETHSQILGCAVTLFWFMQLRFLETSRTLGPVVRAILAIVPMVVKFLVIYTVVLVAFSTCLVVLQLGVAETDSDEIWEWSSVGAAMVRLFEASLGNFEVAKTARRSDGSWNWAFLIVLILYLLVSAVMLLNVLIALLSDKFQEVQNRAKQEWALARARMLWEWMEDSFGRRRLPLLCSAPSPLNCIALLASAVTWVLIQLLQLFPACRGSVRSVQLWEVNRGFADALLVLYGMACRIVLGELFVLQIFVSFLFGFRVVFQILTVRLMRYVESSHIGRPRLWITAVLACILVVGLSPVVYCIAALLVPLDSICRGVYAVICVWQRVLQRHSAPASEELFFPFDQLVNEESDEPASLEDKEMLPVRSEEVGDKLQELGHKFEQQLKEVRAKQQQLGDRFEKKLREVSVKQQQLGDQFEQLGDKLQRLLDALVQDDHQSRRASLQPPGNNLGWG